MEGSAKIDKCNIKAAKQRTITPPKFRDVYSLMESCVNEVRMCKKKMRARMCMSLCI